MTYGKAFIMEQVHPLESMVVNISLPDDFSGRINKLLITLADSVPLAGPPAAVLADISNGDVDADGIGDIDSILSGSNDLTLAFEDVGVTGNYHVIVALYMEGGGTFQPVSGIDYIATSSKLDLGHGQVTADLQLELVQ